MGNKLRMKNKKFNKIVIPVVSAISLLAIVATIGMNMFDTVMDDYLGKGEKYVVGESATAGSLFYEDIYKDHFEARDEAYKLAREVQNEGTVLLKNNGVLPLANKSKVAPFGYRYVSPIYGQVSESGSAKWTVNPTTPHDGLKDKLTIVESTETILTKAGTPTALVEAAGTLSAGSLNDLMGGDSKIYEFAPSVYQSVSGTLSDSTALVFVGRAGQEGSDKKYDGYTDGTPHYLALTTNEKETIKFAKQNCAKVVVVVESSAAMELTPIMAGEYEADAIIQVGHVGEKGFEALGDILTGAVNPSGRTVDIWPADFTKDPTYQNFGEFTYTNATFKSHSYGEPSSKNEDGTYNRYFFEYQEDVYLGYKYYETAAIVDPSFAYANEVNFSFGHGLSYTTFNQTVKTYKDSGDSIEMEIEVENTGSKDGKDVVQIYYTAPYTEFDKTNKIEKPFVNLITFEKTGLIKAGEKETVSITFKKEEMASYCYTHINQDQTKGAYVLENGDYDIRLAKNSHEFYENRKTTIAETVWYDSSNPRSSEVDAQSILNKDGTLTKENKKGGNFVAATNQFQECSDYMNSETTHLSRANWNSTFPTRPTDDKKTISASTVSLFGIEETFDPANDPLLGNVPGSVVYRSEEYPVENKGLVLSDMRGIPFNDPKWDEYLNQVNYKDATQLDQIKKMMTGANYTTTGVDVLGLSDSKHADGANGIKAFKTNDGMKDSCTYGYAPLMASTWNTELMKRVGNMLGVEAMKNGVYGWYSPAINIHRSPFSGRVFEYYSEDPVLTGKIAASVVSGAGDAGLYCYIKHFALNDQETNRQFFVHTWATEQAIREIYLKAFEIPFKEAKMTVKYYDAEAKAETSRVMRAATAVMASQNDIGPTIAHGNYSLLTKVLRNEWGFEGTVHSDMYVWQADKNMYDLTFRSGCDTFLTFAAIGGIKDIESPTTHGVMRRALHDVCYTVANSSLMNGISGGQTIKFKMSPWKVTLIWADTIIAVAALAVITLTVLRNLDGKKHPENYKQ